MLFILKLPDKCTDCPKKDNCMIPGNRRKEFCRPGLDAKIKNLMIEQIDELF